MKKSPYVITLFLVVFLAGCNLPFSDSNVQETQSPEAVFTQAAQTVAAELTQVALLASPTSNVPIVPTSTFTPSSTNTTVYTPTNTPFYTATNTPIPATWQTSPVM